MTSNISSAELTDVVMNTLRNFDRSFPITKKTSSLSVNVNVYVYVSEHPAGLFI